MNDYSFNNIYMGPTIPNNYHHISKVRGKNEKTLILMNLLFIMYVHTYIHTYIHTYNISFILYNIKYNNIAMYTNIIAKIK